MQFQFNGRQHDPFSGGYEALPPGIYPVYVKKSNIKATNANDGGYLQLDLEVTEGPHKGKTIFDRLNLFNNNDTAVRIANQRLAAICHATNIWDINGSDATDNAVPALHNTRFSVRLVLTPGKKTRDTNGMEIEGKPGNNIDEYLYLDGSKIKGGSGGGQQQPTGPGAGFGQQQPQQQQPQPGYGGQPGAGFQQPPQQSQGGFTQQPPAGPMQGGGFAPGGPAPGGFGGPGMAPQGPQGGFGQPQGGQPGPGGFGAQPPAGGAPGGGGPGGWSTGQNGPGGQPQQQQPQPGGPMPASGQAGPGWQAGGGQPMPWGR